MCAQSLVFEPILTDIQFTEKASRQPEVTILEARDICGSATGRNGQKTSMVSIPGTKIEQEDN
jgi:hypothetical protein